jgi:hypothetical protein
MMSSADHCSQEEALSVLPVSMIIFSQKSRWARQDAGAGLPPVQPSLGFLARVDVPVIISSHRMRHAPGSDPLLAACCR